MLFVYGDLHRIPSLLIELRLMTSHLIHTPVFL